MEEEECWNNNNEVIEEEVCTEEVDYVYCEGPNHVYYADDNGWYKYEWEDDTNYTYETWGDNCSFGSNE
jgi:hypothetical protein